MAYPTENETITIHSVGITSVIIHKYKLSKQLPVYDNIR